MAQDQITRRPTKSRPGSIARREHRRQETREYLISVAQRLVGNDGYANATISRIAEAADTSLGGFYHYFGSQAELFETLLPSIGTEFFEHRNKRVDKAETYLEFEQLDFLAVRDFIRARPEFLRIFFEAPHFAPVAYESHIRFGRNRYLKRLEKAWDDGGLRSYARDELPAIAEIILSSKIYLFRFYTKKDGPVLPDTMIETYLRFLKGGLSS